MGERIEFNISAIALVLFLFLISRIRHQVHSIRTKLVYVLMFCNVTAAMAEIVAGNMTVRFSEMPYWAAAVANAVRFLADGLVVVAVFYYNYYLVRPYKHDRIRFTSWCLLPFYLLSAMLTVNLFYPFIYGIDKELQRCEFMGMNLFYSILAFYYLAAVITVVRHREQIDGRKLAAIYLYLVICMGGRLADIFYPKLMANNFCISLAIAIIMLNVQDMDEMMDMESGVLNRGCFKESIVYRDNEHKPCILLYLYFAGLTDYQEMLTMEKKKKTQKTVAEILGQVCRDGVCYRLSDEVFTVLYESDRERESEKAGKAFLELMEAYFSRNLNTGIAGHVAILKCPEDLETLEDMLSAADFLSGQLKYFPDAVIPKEKIEIQKQNRKVQLGKRILEILQNNAYEICYQPVYDRKRKLIAGACASVKLDDSMTEDYEDYMVNYGRLQGVMMFEDKMFEDVCEMIQKSDTISNGREFIEVAFSDAQFMQGDFVDKILNTLKKYQVEPERIRLCITEPILASMNTSIEKNLHELAEAGISFSLVNYGKGQSNFDRLNRLSFDTVEFDEKLVSTEDFDSREKEIILNAQLEALHRFGKKIRVYIGEDENPVAKQLSSDFIRGEAVPAEKFASMLQKQSAIQAVRLL